MSSSFIKQLKKWDLQYYETGKSPVSDAKYDREKKKARKASPKDPYFLEVGAPVTTGQKAKLPAKAGSLDKIRPDDVPAWIKRLGKLKYGYVMITPKLDGLSGVLHYRNGKLFKAYTRGNGIVGRIVTLTATHVQGVIKKLKTIEVNGKTLKAPKDLFVRGEFVMHNSIFNRHYRKEAEREGYKTPRNFAVGMLNRKNLKPDHIRALKRMTFIVYSLFGMQDGKLKYRPTKNDEFSKAIAYGFTPITIPSRYTKGHFYFLKKLKEGVYSDTQRKLLPILEFGQSLKVWHDVKKITPEFVKAQLKLFTEKVDIDLDGLVIEVDSREDAKKLGYEANGLNPKFARSIKLDVTEQETKIGKIAKVEWNISRRRLYKPRVWLKKKLQFKGVDVIKMTAYNAQFVIDYGLKPGVLIKVIRSGDVIPRIMQVKQEGRWIKVDS